MRTGYAKPSTVTAVFSAMLQNDNIDDYIIDKLEQIINKRKEQVDKK